MCFVKIETANCKIAILNNFDPSNTYTYEVGKDCKLLFFDVVLIHHCYYSLSKTTTKDIYLNWKSFAPTTTCKKGTFNTLVDSAYLICLNIALRKKEIDHLRKVFH